MRRIASLVLSITFATACSASPPAPATPAALTVGGVMSVPRSYAGGIGQDCFIEGGYSDIKEGTQVVITDEADKTIALGRLESGKVDSSRSSRCVFPFSVTKVPAGRPFYGIEVSHRGRLQYTAEQIAMSLQLTLGD